MSILTMICAGGMGLLAGLGLTGGGRGSLELGKKCFLGAAGFAVLAAASALLDHLTN